MTLFHVLALAAVQGLTEFLPVSSSGHLALLQTLFGMREGTFFLDVVLHVGTLGSVLWVYRREAGRLLRLDRPARAYVGTLALATLPAVGVGLLLKRTVEALFANPLLVACALLLTGALLLSTRAARPARSDSATLAWEPAAPSPWRALAIGCAQALAIVPGLSRSGATIAAALWTGLPRAESARFAFLLSVPAILGALVLHLLDDAGEGGQAGLLLLGAAVAFAVGLVAIRWTARAVVNRHFWKFALYCFAVGGMVIVRLLAR